MCTRYSERARPRRVLSGVLGGGGGGREPSALPMAAAAAATVTDARAASLPNVTRSGSRVCALSTGPSVWGGVFFFFPYFLVNNYRKSQNHYGIIHLYPRRGMCEHV